jgi:hypothetical protein
MSSWKEILFGILAILLMGIAGEMDYQDQMRIDAELKAMRVMLEEIGNKIEERK